MNTCTQCLQTRRRAFFSDRGVCDECDPNILLTALENRELHDPTWPLSYVTAMARYYVVAHPGIEWVTEAVARETGVHSSASTVLSLFGYGLFPDTLPGADECDAWLRSLATTPDEHALSDYECSLALLVKKGWVGEHEWSLAAGAYHAWTKTRDSRPLPTGEWLGAIKDRIVVTGCVCTGIKALGINPDHPEWGARFLITFTAANGADIKWFASEGGIFDPRPGSTYNIRGTVTRHDEYEGHRSTILSRVVDDDAPPRKRTPKGEPE